MIVFIFGIEKNFFYIKQTSTVRLGKFERNNSKQNYQIIIEVRLLIHVYNTMLTMQRTFSKYQAYIPFKYMTNKEPLEQMLPCANAIQNCRTR